MNTTLNSEPNATAIVAQCNGLKTVNFERTTAVVATIVGTCVINSFFSLFAIGSNALSIFVLARKMSLRTPANLLIASMALSDLLVGLIVQVTYVVLRMHELWDIHLCTVKRAFAFFGYYCSGVSMLTISSFSLDRFFAVCFPYRYTSDAIYHWYASGIVGYWIAWMIYTLLPAVNVMSPERFHFSLSIVMVLSLSVSVACYVKVYAVIRRHRKKICASIPVPRPETGSFQDSGATKCDLVWVKSQRRRSKTTIVIIAAFVACFIPKIIQLVTNLLLGNILNVLYVGGKWSDTVIFINSSLNPIIYVIRVEEIRREILAVIRRIRDNVTALSQSFWER